MRPVAIDSPQEDWARSSEPEPAAEVETTAGGPFRLRPALQYLGVLVFFVVTITFFARSALEAPFFSDDFHLIRTYSTTELENVWFGPWDPDEIETPGFRPLTTLFNHVRFGWFGERPEAHRSFLFALFAVYLTMTVGLLRATFEAPLSVGLLGGLLSFLHTANVYHYLWISDGIHLLTGILVIGAVLALSRGLGSGKVFWLLLSVSLSAGALLSREDGLVALPILVLFLLLRYVQGRLLAGMSLKLGLYVGLLAVCAAGYVAWRTTHLPAVGAPRLDPSGYVWSLAQIVQILGDPTHLVVWWPQYITLMFLWLVGLGIAGGLALGFASDRLRRQAGFWAVAACVGALPTLAMARTNVLLLPTTFFGLGLATVLHAVSLKSATGHVTALLLAVFALATSAYGSNELQQLPHRLNLDYICNSAQWIYGSYSYATIPEPRKAIVREHLTRLGIYSLEDMEAKLPILIDEAQAHRRYYPDPTGLQFIPRFRFNNAPNWQDWSCVGKQGWRF
jgi:hypothetical protein